MKLSARNQLKGKITGVDKGAVMANIKGELRKRVKSVSLLFPYYPAASQPLKIDVRFSNAKTWSGSGHNPRQ